MKARAGSPDLAGHTDQRDQAACVVGAVHMLADAHAPQNHRAFGFGKSPCHFAQSLGRDTANRRHGFGAIAFDVIAQCFVIASAVGDKGFVGQAFFNHRVD